MSDVVCTSRVKIERLQGPIRLAYLPAEDQAATFGVHGATWPGTTAWDRMTSSHGRPPWIM